MVYMPLIASIYEPRIAAITMLLVDFVPAARRSRCQKCAAAPGGRSPPISVATAIAVPVGTYLLLVLDPILLRWIIASLVLTLVAVLMSGWRYRRSVKRGDHRRRRHVIAGLGAGAAQIAGPPVILYWLSRGNTAVTLRANLMVFFMFCGIVLIASYATQGLFTPLAIALSLMLAPPYMLGVGAGSYFFRGASDRLYRLVAYVICMLAALLSLPVLDPLLR